MTLYWIFVISSLVLQAAVVVYSVRAYSMVGDPVAWFWFTMASLCVFVRRMLLPWRLGTPENTHLWWLEHTLTISISILWLIYVWYRCKGARR